MKKSKLASAGFVAGAIATCICILANLEHNDHGNDRHQEELMQRIALVQKSTQNVGGLAERLIDDICAVSNRDVQVALMQFFAKSVKTTPCDSLDLQLRYRELSRCRLLTEKVCDGFRKILGYSPDVWDLRFSMLGRYVTVTNECYKSWDRFEKYEKMKDQDEITSGASPFMSSGQGQAGWLKAIEGDIDHYLMEMSKWHYRVDTCRLSDEERIKIKSTIEKISGRKLVFVEPQ